MLRSATFSLFLYNTHTHPSAHIHLNIFLLNHLRFCCRHHVPLPLKTPVSLKEDGPFQTAVKTSYWGNLTWIQGYFNGRKWRGTKEPLDKGERREGESWRKAQHSKTEDHGIQSHHFMANRRWKSRSSDRFYFGGFPTSLWMVTVAKKLKGACSLEVKLWQI